MDLDELRKMKETVESAGRDVEKGIHETTASFERDWNEATAGLSHPTTRCPTAAGRRRPNTAAPTRTGASSAALSRSGTRHAMACAARCSRARRGWRFRPKKSNR
jgi:sec-independent protein translocase protein TatB